MRALYKQIHEGTRHSINEGIIQEGIYQNIHEGIY
jgi:hypothetical protein